MLSVTYVKNLTWFQFIQCGQFWFETFFIQLTILMYMTSFLKFPSAIILINSFYWAFYLISLQLKALLQEQDQNEWVLGLLYILGGIYLIKFELNHFQSMLHFYTLWKYWETGAFFHEIFSWVIKVKNWLKMG